MKYGKIYLALLLLLVLGLMVCGCDGKITTSQERDDGFLSTKKSTTRCGIGGCEKESKSCPFWDRDC